MDGIREFQLDLMLVLSGICGTIAFFVAITRTIGWPRKWALLCMEVGAMILLTADRLAYVYRGNTSGTGIYMTHICNFLAFFMTLFLLWAFNNYLKDLYQENNPGKPIPQRIKLVGALAAIGAVMLIVSQFTGFYYTFDQNNCYQRAAGYPVCYLIPVIIFILQLSAIVTQFKNLRRNTRIALILFAVLPLCAAAIQLFVYGLSLINITLVGMIVLLYIFSLLDANDTVERAKNLEITMLKDEQEYFRTIFVQTAEALASAIDFKDKYTHGHSRRVAEYSQKLARIAGFDDKQCDEVFFAALLHDVGKIGIPDTIINKEGRLTAEEFAEIKKHPLYGKQILSSISRSPYLVVGANYHHERYDGKGYPEGLKGEEIPEIARIIAVADAYDAMTSKRSYRDPIPQQLVREEFVKGIATQFDPGYARIMLHLIDIDSEYRMKERREISDSHKKTEYHFENYRSDFTDGIAVTAYKTKLRMYCRGNAGALAADTVPSLILFDSLDGKVHDHDSREKHLSFFEFCEIRLDGHVIAGGARDIHTNILKPTGGKMPDWKKLYKAGLDYTVEAVRWKDHVKIRILCDYLEMEIIIALPDNSRFTYISLTGRNCVVSGLRSSKSAEPADENEIPRIAEEVSYIKGPNGDLPNIQIDGWRTAVTSGIRLKDKTELLFRTLSLPTARLVWHCPFVVLFTSDDGLVEGENYRELALICMDGECWENEENAKNDVTMKMTDSFVNWDTWKGKQKAGIDCKVTIIRKGNTITTSVESAGIQTHNVTTLYGNASEIYVALTGDQCALTNIRIR